MSKRFMWPSFVIKVTFTENQIEKIKTFKPQNLMPQKQSADVMRFKKKTKFKKKRKK